MKTLVLLAGIATLIALTAGHAQLAPMERIGADNLDVAPPSLRVEGPPGQMKIRTRGCASVLTATTRQRIVDLAIQEWGFFGFSIVDETRPDSFPSFARQPATDGRRSSRRRRRVDPVEAERVASTIGGYWAATPDGSWILDRQNGRWNGADGLASRWRDPWSAAFVSWVMCEGGLGDSSRFRRAIAHHVYVDQAITARDTGETRTAFTAHDVGETEVEPGDLLCSGRRPGYTSIAQRRRQIGVGARMHCDIVVKVDPERRRILAVGGNVRGTVSLKLLPASSLPGKNLGPAREIFAHLKLHAEPVEPDAMDNSPTFRALGCRTGFQTAALRRLTSSGGPTDRDC